MHTVGLQPSFCSVCSGDLRALQSKSAASCLYGTQHKGELKQSEISVMQIVTAPFQQALGEKPQSPPSRWTFHCDCTGQKLQREFVQDGVSPSLTPARQMLEIQSKAGFKAQGPLRLSHPAQGCQGFQIIKESKLFLLPTCFISLFSSTKVKHSLFIRDTIFIWEYA